MVSGTLNNSNFYSFKSYWIFEMFLIKYMKYAFLNFLYLQILQLWILIMLKLTLTLINKKSVVTHFSNLLLETAASKMRNWNV